MNKTHIAFIGMSGVGKTRWTTDLARRGHTRVCCDDLIEQQLLEHLRPLGYEGIADVAAWMGQPYDGRYSDTSHAYLEAESRVVREITNILDFSPEESILIDTTGSLVHLDEEVITELKKRAIFVYIEADDSHVEKLFQNYIKHPKPVIWGEHFVNEPELSHREALHTCYPKLLAYRREKYARLADITVPMASAQYHIYDMVGAM